MDQETFYATPNKFNFNFFAINTIYMSPIFVTFFFLMLSLCNYDFKGLVWLACVLCGMVLVFGVQLVLSRSMGQNQPDAKCLSHTLHVPLIHLMKYSNPCMSSFFFAFTLFYLIMPMQANKSWNMFAISGFILLLISDSVVQFRLSCAKIGEIALGVIIGAFYGWACYLVLKTMNLEKLMYYTMGSSNNVYCSKPKEQSFKCSVYKNGQLISSM
jgi:hypothetical protein